jgi:hypothetical protein
VKTVCLGIAIPTKQNCFPSFIPTCHSPLQLTISNSSLTSFSESPRYLEVRVEEETLKNVVQHSVTTALANMVFPVPGGPTISTPFHGRRKPCTQSMIFIFLMITLISQRSVQCEVQPATPSTFYSLQHSKPRYQEQKPHLFSGYTQSYKTQERLIVLAYLEVIWH